MLFLYELIAVETPWWWRMVWIWMIWSLKSSKWLWIFFGCMLIDHIDELWDFIATNIGIKIFSISCHISLYWLYFKLPTWCWIKTQLNIPHILNRADGFCLDHSGDLKKTHQNLSIVVLLVRVMILTFLSLKSSPALAALIDKMPFLWLMMMMEINLTMDNCHIPV